MTRKTSARRVVRNGRKASRSGEPRASKLANEWLTVDEFCAEMRITRRTYERWRRRGCGPQEQRLGGEKGPIRIRRWIDEWLAGDAA